MITLKRKASRRISVWTLVLALVLALSFTYMVLPAGASPMENAKENVRDASDEMGDALSEAGNAVSDVGDAVSERIDDMSGDGAVRDHDGFIGNERAETSPDTTDEGEDAKSMGWIGVVIAIAVVLVVVILIVLLVPKKKER